MKDTKIPINLAIQFANSLLFKVLFFFLIGFIFIPSKVIYAQDLRDLDHTLKFANYLFKTQQYALAAEEYERAFYYDTTNTTSLLKLLQSYRYAEKPDQVIVRFDYFFKDNLYTINTDLAREYVKNLFLIKEFPRVFDYLEKKYGP